MTQAPSVKPPPRSRCSCGSPTLTIVVSAACIAVATMTANVANRLAERVAPGGAAAIAAGRDQAVPRQIFRYRVALRDFILGRADGRTIVRIVHAGLHPGDP